MSFGAVREKRHAGVRTGVSAGQRGGADMFTRMYGKWYLIGKFVTVFFAKGCPLCVVYF